MRKDLAKCTTESPRHGLSNARFNKLKYGGTVRIHPDPEHDYLDEYGGYRPSGRHRQWDPKNFSDCLGALRGNIRKNVGRPWDKVYSEFAQLLDRRSLSGHHIWTHLMQEVEVNTYLQDGVVYGRSRYSFRSTPVSGYYVHPITGILEYQAYISSRTRRRNRKVEIDKLEFDVPGCSDWKYVLLDGLWFRRRITTAKRQYFFGGYHIETIIEKKSANRKEIAWIKQGIVKLGLHP